GVIAPDADDLAAGDDRSQQPHVFQGDLLSGQLNRPVERVALQDRDDGLTGLVLAYRAETRLVTRRPPRDTHVGELIRSGCLPWNACTSVNETGRPGWPSTSGAWTSSSGVTCAADRQVKPIRSRTSCSPTTRTVPPSCGAGTRGSGGS